LLGKNFAVRFLQILRFVNFCGAEATAIFCGGLKFEILIMLCYRVLYIAELKFYLINLKTPQILRRVKILKRFKFTALRNLKFHYVLRAL